MKLKYLKLDFENCESIEIDGKYIGDFYVDDIYTSIRRVACNSIKKIETAHTIALEIHKEANKTHDAFGLEDCEDCKAKVFSRLEMCPDIVDIEFELYDNFVREGETPQTESYHYAVAWTGDSDYINSSQTTYVSDAGHLYIVISDKQTFEDIFDKEEIDSRDYNL